MFRTAVKPQKNISVFMSWLKLGSIHDWLSVLLIFLTLLIAVLSIEQAQWALVVDQTTGRPKLAFDDVEPPFSDLFDECKMVTVGPIRLGFQELVVVTFAKLGHSIE